MSQNYPQDYQMNHVTNENLQRYSDVDVLSTEGRIGRKRYFVYSTIFPLIVFWAIATLASLVSYLPIANNILFYGFIGFAIIAMLLMTVRLTIQRCHDFNKSGVLAIFAIIPLANIIFALIPGTNGLNQYGEVPKPASWLFKTSFYGLVAVLFIVGIYFAMQFGKSSYLSNLLAF